MKGSAPRDHALERLRTGVAVNAARTSSNVLKTGLQVIEALKRISSERAPTTLTELASYLGASAPTAFRVAETLIAAGLVERLSNGGYTATMDVVGLGAQVLGHVELRQLAAPLLTKVAEEFEESVTIAIPQVDHVVFVERIVMDPSVEFYCDVGKRLPLHAGAASRAVLAHISDRQFERYVARPLCRLADGTLVTADSVRRDRDEVRSLGYSTSVDDVDLGISGVGAAIVNGRGEPVGAAAIANLTVRWSAEDRRKRGERMREVVAEISAKCVHLGGSLGGSR